MGRDLPQIIVEKLIYYILNDNLGQKQFHPRVGPFGGRRIPRTVGVGRELLWSPGAFPEIQTL